MNEGWVCPRCERVWAPSVLACDCPPEAAHRASDDAHGARTSAPDDAQGAAQGAAHAAQAVAHVSKSLGPRASHPKTPRRKHNYEDHPQFEQFWEVYPSKRDKLRAFNAWLAFVVRANVDPVRVIDAAQAYVNDPLRTQENTKYAEGWLSGERWNDELTVRRPSVPLDDEPAINTPEWQEKQDREFREMQERLAAEEANA